MSAPWRMTWKLSLALLGTVGLALVAPGGGAAPRVAASGCLLLGLAAASALVLRKRGAAQVLAPPPRLSVAARASLSPRCGLALVEADGQRLLVAYGDGFAAIHPGPAPQVRP